MTAFVKYNSKSDWGFLEDLPKSVLNKIKIIYGDLRDADAVRHACKDIDMVYHLGALIAIPYSYENPRDYFETNTLGTLNLMIGCKEHNVKRIIHTSTSEVYGTAKYTPIDEEHPLQAQSPYSASKIGADKVAESFFCSYNLPIIVARPFNTYGPRQSARAVIPSIISQALTQDTIMVGNLNTKRDFTFVKDTVNGMVTLGEKGKIGQIYNIASNQTQPISDILKTIIRLLDKKIVIKIDRQRFRPDKSEVLVLQGKTDKIQKIGWQPKINLNDGLLRTIKYIKAHIKEYKTEVYNI